LVTGASGFIAVHVVKILLERGFTVIGTVRSPNKGHNLQNLFKEYGDRFSYVIVEDVSVDGAFDKVVVGVEAVQHLATAVSFQVDDPQDLIRPAVLGTIGILESVKKYAPTVKRVVLTSSVASVIHKKDKPDATYDESDWNTDSPKIVEEKGREAPGQEKYRTAKVLAERAAWDFVEKNKGSINFDIVTFCPPFVLGPILHDVPSADKLNISIGFFHKYTTKCDPPISKEELSAGGRNWCDVRDVALCQVLALEKPEAGNERYIVSSGPFTWQDVLDALHTNGSYPDVPKGYPGAGKDVVHGVMLSHKVEKTMGLKLRSLADSATATLASLKERGF